MIMWHWILMGVLCLPVGGVRCQYWVILLMFCYKLLIVFIHNNYVFLTKTASQSHAVRACSCAFKFWDFAAFIVLLPLLYILYIKLFHIQVYVWVPVLTYSTLKNEWKSCVFSVLNDGHMFYNVVVGTSG